MGARAALSQAQAAAACKRARGWRKRCRRTSVKELAPTGRIMNSCMASLLPAWLPPLMMLNEGTGMYILPVGLPASSAMCLYSGLPLAAAPALQTAIETPRMALAPSLALDQPHSFLEPSSSWTILSSMTCCSLGSMPTRAGPMMEFTFSTACSRVRTLSAQCSGRAVPGAGELGTGGGEEATAEAHATKSAEPPDRGAQRDANAPWRRPCPCRRFCRRRGARGLRGQEGGREWADGYTRRARCFAGRVGLGKARLALATALPAVRKGLDNVNRRSAAPRVHCQTPLRAGGLRARAPS